MKQLAKKTGLLSLYRRLRYGKQLPKKKLSSYPWSGNYKNWDSARTAAGDYSNPHILEKVLPAVLAVKNGEAVYERDSVIFDKAEYPEALVNALLRVAEENKGILHVVDFGGSLGSTYFQVRSYLQAIPQLSWSVVEQSHFVEAGQKSIADEYLNFYYTIGEVGAAKNSVVLLSGVLQCLAEPYLFLSEEITGKFDYIIVDRTGFIAGAPPRITVQNVPKEIFDASYPAWFFNEQQFLDQFTGEYDIIDDFKSFADPDLPSDDGKKLYWKGFFLKLKQVNP